MFLQRGNYVEARHGGGFGCECVCVLERERLIVAPGIESRSNLLMHFVVLFFLLLSTSGCLMCTSRHLLFIPPPLPRTSTKAPLCLSMRAKIQGGSPIKRRDFSLAGGKKQRLSLSNRNQRRVDCMNN